MSNIPTLNIEVLEQKLANYVGCSNLGTRMAFIKNGTNPIKDVSGFGFHKSQTFQPFDPFTECKSYYGAPLKAMDIEPSKFWVSLKLWDDTECMGILDKDLLSIILERC